MLRLHLRTAAAVTLAVATAACAGDTTITATPDAGAMSASAHASPARTPFSLSATAVTLQPGATHTISAIADAPDRPVPPSSISWSTADAAVATVSDDGVVTGIAAGQTTVSATRGAHRLDVVVTVAGACTVQPMALGPTSGELTEDDCRYEDGRPVDFYGFHPAMGEVITIQSTGENALVGLKEPQADPRLGTGYGTVAVGGTFRAISNGDPVQLFLGGRTDSAFGAYSLTRGIGSSAHDCGILTFMMPGASFGTALTSANACHYTVAYSPVPEAIGKPLWAHNYYVWLGDVRSHTVTIGGLSDTFDAALTVFRSGAGPVGQAVPDGNPAPSSRTVTFTPPAPGYYVIEVSTGRFVDGLENWVNHSGAYTLSLSR